MIKVSIVIISYNQGQFIEETIKSVVAQSYENTELILIDGGSTDTTMEIVGRYENNFSVVIHEKDKGQSDAINKGFKLATGDLVGWINSDDILYPNCVRKIVECYEENKQGSIFYSEAIEKIDVKSEKVGGFKRCIPDKKYLLEKDYSVSQQGSFYSLKAVKQSGFLDEGLCYCMDLDLWLNLLNYGTIHRVEGEPLAAFRIGDYTKTNNGGVSFLSEARSVLLKHGASLFYPTIIRLYWSEFKCYLRRIIK